MARLKDYFVMTRHERAGSIVIAIVMVAVIAITCALRNCTAYSVAQHTDTTAVSKFMQQADSLQRSTAVAPAKRHHKGNGSTKPRKKQPQHTSKPDQDRRIEPVPQF